MEVLKSQIDHSVNFVTHTNDGGAFESRFVHRPGTDYFIAYLSTFSGCNQACRMCHLTATGQTTMEPADERELMSQLIQVIDHAEGHYPHLKKMHVNFMARGEPLLNSTLWSHWYQVFTQDATDLAEDAGIEEVKYLVSTIMPKDFIDNKMDQFGKETAFYYSLYSVEREFRRRWLPKAMHPIHAISKLKRWQDDTGGTVKIHYALIKGENDSTAEAHRIADLIEFSGLDATVNLIRYNPPNEKSEEAAEARYTTAMQVFDVRLPGSKIIPRVGADVYASCGMFVNG